MVKANYGKLNSNLGLLGLPMPLSVDDGAPLWPGKLGKKDRHPLISLISLT